MSYSKKSLPIGLVALAVLLSLGSPHLSYAGDENSEWSAGSLWNGPFFNGPNQGFQISVQTPDGIPQHSTQSAKITGTINLVGVKFNLDDQDDDSHGYKHGLTLLERLVSKGYRVQAYWPDLTTPVDPAQVFLSSSDGKTIQFRFNTPALQSSDLNLFTLQVMLPSNELANMQKVQAKFDRRIVGINALIAKLSAKAKTDAKDIASLKRLRDKLLAASAGMGGWLAQRPDVLAEARFPLQVDNKVATSSLNSTIMGKFRLQIAYDLGSAIEGEKTTVHGKVTNLKVPDWDDFFGMDLNPSEKTDQGESPHRWVTRVYWGSSLLKEFSAQSIAEGQSVLFDFDTDKLDPADSNTFLIKHYSWHDKEHRVGSLGSVFAHLSLKLPVANDNTSPVVLAGATPDAPHSCVYDMQPVNISLLDTFGLIDPTTIQASLRGTLNNGTSVGGDVTGRVSAVSPDQGQNYLLTDSGVLNPTSEGVYTFSTKSQDLAENFTLPNPYSATFRVNRTAPVISLTVDDSAIYTNKPYTNRPNLSFGVTVIDYFDRCSITTTALDNGVQIAQFSTPTSLVNSTMIEGLNIFEVSSVNASDGLSAEPQRIQVILDTIPPVLGNVVPADNAIRNTLSFPVSGKSVEPLLSAKLNGNPLQLSEDKLSYSGFYTAQVAGPAYLHFEVEDLATNVTKQDITVQIILKVLNGDLLTTFPDPDGLHAIVVGSQSAARPGVTVYADAGFFNSGQAIAASDGSFSIRLAIFRSATLRATDMGHTDTATVTFIQGDGTILAGAVKDTSGNPIAGVTVSFASSNISSALTDANGVFRFSQPVTGDQKLLINGSTALAAQEGLITKKFSSTSVLVNVGLGQNNVLPRAIYLAPILLDGSSTPVLDGQRALVEDELNAPGVKLDIPALQGISNFPDGTHSGDISIATISSDFSTIPPPEVAVPTHVVTLEPSGLKFSSTVQVTLPNDNDLPVGAEFAIFSMNSSSGRWELDGTAAVSADKRSVVTKPGQGISHFSTIFAAPLGPVILPTKDGDQRGVDHFSGALTSTITLPSSRVLGQDIAPALLYKSNWAKPSALISNTFTVPPQRINLTHITESNQYTLYEHEYCGRGLADLFFGHCVLAHDALYTEFEEIESFFAFDKIKAQFFAPGLVGDPVEFDGRNIATKGELAYLLDFKDKTTQEFLPTGAYPYLSSYEVQLKNITLRTVKRTYRGAAHIYQSKKDTQFMGNPYDSWTLPPTIQGEPSKSDATQVYQEDVAGTLFLQNEAKSPAGRGWKIAGIQKIVNPADNRIMIEQEDGSVASYAINNTIDTVLDGNVFGLDLNRGTDLSAWPNIVAVDAAMSIHKLNAQSQSNTVFAPNYGLGGTLSGFLYVDVDPDKHAEDNYSSCFRDYYSFNVAGSLEQPVLMPNGDVIASDSNRSLLSYFSPGSSRSIAGRLESDFPNFSPFSDRIFCKSDGNGCRVNYDGPYLDITGIRSSISSSLNFYCSTMPGASCSHSALQDYGVDHFGGCGPGSTSTGSRPNPGWNGDGSSTSAQLNRPMGIVRGPGNSVVFADNGNNRVRKFDLDSGAITTLAGNGTNGDSGDGGAATLAGLYHPRGVTYDSLGNLYISTENGFIRKVDTSNIISTFAGARPGPDSTTADIATAEQVVLSLPYGMIVDNQNQVLYVAEYGSNAVRSIELNGVAGVRRAVVVVGNHSTNASAGALSDGQAALNASLIRPSYLGLDDQANLLVVDTGTNRIRRVIFQTPQFGVVTFLPSTLDHSTLKRQADNTWVRQYRNGGKAVFDASGGEIYTEDNLHLRTSFGYVNGRLVSITDPTGNVTQYNYLGTNLDNIRDSTGRVTSFHYDGSGNLLSAIFPGGSSRAFTYDENGLMKTETDQELHTTNYIYNRWGRIHQVVPPNGKPITVNDSGSVAMANDYVGGAVGVMPAPGVGAGESASFVEDANSVKTTYVKDMQGFVSTVLDPSNIETKIKYNLRGNPLEITRKGADGTLIGSFSMSYDPDTSDLLLTKDNIKGTEISQTYDKETTNYGLVTSKTNESGDTTLLTYTPAGQLKSVNAVDRDPVAYSYNQYGELTSVTVGTHPPSINEYDLTTGNLKSSMDSLGQKTTYTFYPSGFPKNATTPDGHVTTYEYDLFNRMTSVTLASESSSPQRTEYTYLKTGQLETVRDPAGSLTTFQYDVMGRLSQKQDPLGHLTTFTYYPNGNIQTFADPKANALGYRFQYTYNSANRLEQKSTPEGLLTIHYDIAGNVADTSNANAKLVYTYDSSHRLKTEQTTNLREIAPPVTVEYQYDSNGRLAAIIDSLSNVATNYGYNTSGDLTSIQRPSGFTVGVSYDPTGRIGTIQRPGSATSLSYYENGLPHAISHTSTNGASILPSLVYKWNSVGNLSEIDSISSMGSSTRSFSYNEFNELTSSTNPLAPPNYQNEIFTYDSASNRTTKDNLTFSYSYDTKHSLLLEDGNYQYQYDQNGNMILKTAKSAPGNIVKYFYDSENRLYMIKQYAGDPNTPVKTSAYTYDPLNRRISKSITDTLSPSDPIKNYFNRYVYDGSNVHLVLNKQAQVLARYTHSKLRADDILGVEVSAAGVPQLAVSAGTYLYLKDAVGSIVATVNTSGDQIEEYSYSSFGIPQASNALLRVPYGFTGREYDAESGLYYYRARYYDPVLGRFQSQDPIGFAGGTTNLYEYAHNSPLIFTDPSGLASVTNNLPYPVWASGNPGPGQGTGAQIPFVIQPGQTVNKWNPAYVIPYASPVTDVDYVNSSGGPVNYSGGQSPDKISGNDVFFHYDLNSTPGTYGPGTQGQTNINVGQSVGNIIQNGGIGELHSFANPVGTLNYSPGMNNTVSTSIGTGSGNAGYFTIGNVSFSISISINSSEWVIYIGIPAARW